MTANKLIFCADDWGFSPGINEGILDLAEKNLLYSVSCTPNSQYLSHGLNELLELAKRGLKFNIHFNLTYKLPIDKSTQSLTNAITGEFYTFHQLLLKSVFSLMTPDEVRKEFNAQVKVLRDHKIPIIGLDGHQHIHLIPSIYKIIASELKHNNISTIRYMNDPEHLPSYLQGLYFKTFDFAKNSDLTLESCGYLLKGNIKNKKNLIKKLSHFEHLIIHPAKFDDFDLKNMTDKLKTERIIEYKKLLEFFNER